MDIIQFGCNDWEDIEPALFWREKIGDFFIPIRNG